jgi:class 3 adenylate cyclase
MRLSHTESEETPSRPLTENRYDEATVQKAIALAARLQDQHRETLTVAQVQAIADELGIDPAFVRQSLDQLDAAKAAPSANKSPQGQGQAQAQLPKPVVTEASSAEVVDRLKAVVGLPNTQEEMQKLRREKYAALVEWLHLVGPKRWWAIAWLLMPLLAELSGKHRDGPLAAVGFFIYVGVGIYLTQRQKAIDSGQLVAQPVSQPQSQAQPPATPAPPVQMATSLSPTSEVSREAMLAQLFTLQKQLENTRVHRAFLSVDVVHSTEMKAIGSELAVEFSFGQYRKWVEAIVRTEGGELQVAAGDGVMCIFENDEAAVRAAKKLLLDLPRFNVEQNQLSRPFKIRCGINAGEIAYEPGTPIGFLQSSVIDRAAVVQKYAPENSLAVTTNVDPAARFNLPDAKALSYENSDELIYVWQT